MSTKFYIVFNDTDGFTASPDIMTSDEADEFIKLFPRRYDAQGYYRDGRGRKIKQDDVILRKQEVTSDGDFVPDHDDHINKDQQGGIEDTVSQQLLPVNSIPVLNRIIELLMSFDANSLINPVVKNDTRVQKAMWLLNAQFYGSLATIDMFDEFNKVTRP